MRGEELNVLKLKKFQVTEFRSVMDSGWIDCDDVTTLVRVNEAGKSNVILAPWKLNPARNEGEAAIDLLHDMPNAKYTEWRKEPEKHWFIHAYFEVDNGVDPYLTCGQTRQKGTNKLPIEINTYLTA